MSQPLAPEPDGKDWTWAISEPCPDCGFDPIAVEHEEVPRLIRSYAATVRAAAGDTVRPEPAVWSPLEYACHVRDVCVLFAQRLALMRTEDDPVFANWDQDETAIAAKYWAQEPARVSEQLTAGATKLADDFAEVGAEEWERPGRRSNGSRFTIDTFARYLLHDLAHHAWDVRDS